MSDKEDEIDKLLGVKKANLTLVENKGKTPIDDDELPIDDNPVYGFDRTRKPKMMLSFRKANKTTRHIPYQHILMMDETAGQLITVYTHACAITIEGENLEAIAYRIKRGDLSYIQEGTATAHDGARVDVINFEVPGEE
jgi:hypothetical protein